ncbi:MAG: Cna B-type domain-containing protein [Clostridia bacterium]|nr:Cna B-type domain-containing protein [Clostridia bacterium]
MATATKRKFISGVSVICAVMLIVGIFPMVTDSGNKAEATDTGEYYYAPAKLYDYYYDTDNGKSFDYTKDHEIYDTEQMINGQKNGNVYKGGNRWRTQLQVPYEMFNREISKYYSDNGIAWNKHALYFGNFYGTDEENADNERHRTYDANGNYAWYSDVYNNFFLNSNNAPSVNNGRVAVQGLVDSTLSGGTSNGTVTQNGVALPQFNDTFVSNSRYADVYRVGNGFPFNVIREDSSGLISYSYDSLTDGNRYYSSGNIYVQKAENGHDRSSKNFVTVGEMSANDETGFYPFNGNQSIGSSYNGREGINYGFGMRLDIPFNLTKDGTLTGKDGSKKDIIFNFSGDDDIWVFLDGKLVLDMGGDHGRVTGSINFNVDKDSVHIDNVTSSFTDKRRVQAGSKTSYNAKLSDSFSGAYTRGREYDMYKTHTMTVFYMERGMFESNLRVNFNFQPLKNTLTIEEKTLFDNVNAGLLADTVKVSEEDVFRYNVQNKGTPSSGVVGSDFLYPSTNTQIIRNNTTNIGNEERSGIENKAILNKGDSSTPVADNKFYLDTSKMLPGGGANTYWDDNAKLIAYVYGGGSSEFINMNKVSGKDHLYSIDLTGKSQYTNVIFLRCDTGANASMGSSLWSRVQDNGNNRTPADGSGGWSLKSEKNTVKITNWSNSAEWGSNNSSAGSGTNSNFEPSNPDYFNNVANVTYELTDPYATKVNGTALSDAETPFTRNTDSNGNIDLMYGQSAFFDGQFREDGKMRVTQSNTLSTPNYGDEVTFSVGDRATAEYYDTTVRVVDAKNEEVLSKDINNFNEFNRTGEYDYKNNDGTVPVGMTETYVNTVKTGSLKISKSLNPAESVSQSFRFQLELTEIFGKNGVSASSYANIDTSKGKVLNNTGIFTLNAGESIEIKGIPVNTKYEITELSDDTFSLHSSSTLMEGRIIANREQSTTVLNNEEAVNTRNVGTLTLVKEVQAEDPSEILSDEDLNKAYEFEVTLQMPSGVIFSNYANKIGGSWSGSGSVWKSVFSVKQGEDIELKNIPYETIYTVTEKFSDTGWTKSGEVSNVTLNRNNSDPTVTITNTKKPEEKTEYTVYKSWLKDIDGNITAYAVQGGENITLSLTDGTSEVGQYTITFETSGRLSVSPSDNVTVGYERDNWKITFTDLPKNDVSGQEIAYSVKEIMVNGERDSDPTDNEDKIGRFVVTYNQFGNITTITNTYTNVPLVMPQSGGTGREDDSFDYVLLGTGAVMFSALAFFLIIKRRRTQY